MKRALEIRDFKIGATDGDIGRVKDFYFDDQHWALRYLVADTGRWLAGKQVLIAPYAITHLDESAKTVAVNLSKRQVESSPSIEEDLPVSREYEVRYYHYYGWPFYWSGPFLWGHAPLPAAHPARFAPPPETGPSVETRPVDIEAENHLRSIREVSSYKIEAADGDIGHIEDFLLDVEYWAVRYLILDTRNWWPGKRVLVSPQWVNSINWHTRHVLVDLDRSSIKEAPEFGGADQLSREYEERLHRHYGKEPYWKREMQETHAH